MRQFKTKNLESLLKFIEENIDLKHLQQVEKLHVDSLSYKKVPILPLTVIPEIDKKILFPYSEAFYDPCKMMYNEILQTCGGSIYSSVQTKDYFPFHIRSNHGIGIIPSLFGLKCKIINDNMPWVEHVESRDEIKKIIKKGIPDFNSGLGKRVLETHQFYLEKLKDYPRCSQGIKISQPDMQGPFDIAHLMLGTDIFYLVHDDSDLLHEFLELITETYILFRMYIDRYLTDKAAADAVYAHGGIYLGKVIIKDDTAVINLSPEMYKEFSWQYNKKIFDEFRGSFHSCGGVKEWLYDIIGDDNLLSINYGNPEMQNLQQIYEKNRENRMGIISWGYNQDFSFLEDVFAHKIHTGMTLACSVKSITEGKELIDDYLNKWCFSNRLSENSLFKN